MKYIYFIILFSIAPLIHLNADEKLNYNSSSKIITKQTLNSNVRVDVNRMNGVYSNNGIWLYDIRHSDWGLEWPSGSGTSTIFAGGQWIGAIIDNEVHVSSVQHDVTDFQPGQIVKPDSAVNPITDEYRWYTITSDSQGDWDEWPVYQGAPFNDINENGIYDQDEYPSLFGDQTIFSVWNDLADHVLIESEALNIEIHQTVWAFNATDTLGDVHFIKWKLINKSETEWDSVFFSIWLDPDIGTANDDVIGCDSSLGLGFCYNYDNDDQVYGSAPPATGIELLQGPLINDSRSDIQLPDGREFKGKDMLKMSSFMTNYNADNPIFGSIHTAQQAYNLQRGSWLNGQLLTWGNNGTNPDGDQANYIFPGDPETEQSNGWLDSNADDKRFLLSTGPFPMKPWDDSNGSSLPELGEPGVQEIVVAVIAARGSDNLNSVTKLKNAANYLKEFYDVITDIRQKESELNFHENITLVQNYPNPFNPKTVIRYTLPVTSHLDLSIYNTLGQNVANLVSKKQLAGSYEVEWDASGFASGVYFYRIIAGDFVQTKRMLLIK